MHEAGLYGRVQDRVQGRTSEIGREHDHALPSSASTAARFATTVLFPSAGPELVIRTIRPRASSSPSSASRGEPRRARPLPAVGTHPGRRGRMVGRHDPCAGHAGRRDLGEYRVAESFRGLFARPDLGVQAPEDESEAGAGDQTDHAGERWTDRAGVRRTECLRPDLLGDGALQHGELSGRGGFLELEVALRLQLRDSDLIAGFGRLLDTSIEFGDGTSARPALLVVQVVDQPGRERVGVARLDPDRPRTP